MVTVRVLGSMRTTESPERVGDPDGALADRDPTRAATDRDGSERAGGVDAGDRARLVAAVGDPDCIRAYGDSGLTAIRIDALQGPARSVGSAARAAPRTAPPRPRCRGSLPTPIRRARRSRSASAASTVSNRGSIRLTVTDGLVGFAPTTQTALGRSRRAPWACRRPEESWQLCVSPGRSAQRSGRRDLPPRAIPSRRR